MKFKFIICVYIIIQLICSYTIMTKKINNSNQIEKVINLLNIVCITLPVWLVVEGFFMKNMTIEDAYANKKISIISYLMLCISSFTKGQLKKEKKC